MVRFALVALCAISLFKSASAASAMSYGMTMATRAYDAVCWYENLKTFPNTNTDGFTSCSGQAKTVQKQIENPDEQNKAYMESDPEGAKKMYGEFLRDLGAITALPSNYQKSCGKYVTDPDASPASDESDALNDKGNYDYPYKGLAYCLIKALKDKHGDKAIEAVKNERTHKLKNWMQTLLDRENEFRARHGAEPLQLIKPLVDAAQEWAQINANDCDMYHSKDDDPRNKYRGEGTGESLSASSGENNKQIAAYIAADGWYEEIKDYPYPDAYEGDGNDELFHAIGHFTQSVWKGSKYVGYGYAYNPNCGEGKFSQYIAARYYPAGNVQGQYGKNVAPPQD